MATLGDILQARTLSVLRPWALAANLPNARYGKKADVIAQLLAHPEAIPAEVRAEAAPRPNANNNGGPALGPSLNAGPSGSQPTASGPILGSQNDAQPTAGPSGSQLSTLDFSGIADAILARLSPQLASLQAQIDGIRQGQTAGESSLAESLPIPHVAASVPPSATAAATKALEFHPSIPPSVLESVLENKFEVKDLWKLDPLRSEDLAALSKQTDMSRLLQQAAFPDIEDNLVKTKSRYPTLGSVLRPWLIYAQLRELVQPTACQYLVSHAGDLLRLQQQFPSNWAAALNYHLFAAAKRINKGSAFPLEGWLQPDADALQSHFYPALHKTNAAPSAPHPPSYQPTASNAPAWSASSVGTQSSDRLCKNYNNCNPCARVPCPYRHACASCGKERHAQRNCTSKQPA